MPSPSSNFFVPKPVFRRLRGYAFDPILSLQLDTALVNEVVFRVSWEDDLNSGPTGEYLEIVDYDPASKCFYAPLDLNHPRILAQDGLSPSEGNPQFHQQMVYAVAMTTIKNFEKALGRKALWSSRFANGKEEYIQHLRIYPHALREANAYYSPSKRALLFGYFPASAKAKGSQIPGGMVFTCLSHDIIAHETTHALLDGMHRRFVEASHRDSLAFHEAFADIVALFQHFTFSEVVRHQIAQTQGDLTTANLMNSLAHQFGNAIGQYGGLREFIGKEPDPLDYRERVLEPHARGAILVSAIFETFLSIYKNRIADLLRIATNGTGILQEGAIHPDLVNRLAGEATKTAQQILNMCIRALDYCPPIDINFVDYLQALITADTDLVPDDDRGYRVALIEAFRRRGIYPKDRLSWKRYNQDDEEEQNNQQSIFKTIAGVMRDFVHQLDYLDEIPPDMFDSFSEYYKGLVESDANWNQMKERQKIFVLTKAASRALHEVLVQYKAAAESHEVVKFEQITGLYLLQSNQKSKEVSGLSSKGGKYVFEIHSLRGARRIGPDGNTVNQIIISITQNRTIKTSDSGEFKFRGGCTLILDLATLTLRYAIVKNIGDTVTKDEEGNEIIIENERLKRQREYRKSSVGLSLRSTYFNNTGETNEPFALLHRDF